jgi:predicted Holliday junction resolvase-like endonuclease
MLFELLLLASILSSAFIFLKFKKRLKNLEDIEKDNFLLQGRIKEIEQDFTARENTYKDNISTLQESFKLERESIQEKKIEIQTKEKDYENTIVKLQEKLSEQQELKAKVVSQKKSSEVRLGHIAETLAPFLDQFEFEPEQCSFLGQPIDYISFGDEEITFIEVKSGNSQLNSKQRHIRNLVKDKKVNWKEIRIK